MWEVKSELTAASTNQKLSGICQITDGGNCTLTSDNRLWTSSDRAASWASIAKSASESDKWRTERPLLGFCRTCCCNPNLYFWGELFLTLWPCHARWALTMTDLSAAFLLWSLAREWATGRELPCRPAAPVSFLSERRRGFDTLPLLFLF